MSYLGWIEKTFRLASETNQTKELIIPALVMTGCHLSHPIIGFKVIEHSKAWKDETEQCSEKSFPESEKK